MKKTDFESHEKSCQVDLLSNKIFEDAKNGGFWKFYNKGKYDFTRYNLNFVLKPEDSLKNLFAPIREDTLDYFKRYDIAWWREHEDGYFPSGHLLSSQIHCLNHLFALRKDPDAVLAMIKPIGEAAGIQFVKVLPSFIDTKEEQNNYISFEFVYHNTDLIDECHDTRGENCTSIDAMIYAQDEHNKKWLIPIEWKYTEAYSHKDEAFSFNRYTKFVDSNSRIKEWSDFYKHNPFYELGRQTFLMEKLIDNQGKNDNENKYYPLLADSFLHLIIIPNDNKEMNDDAQEFRSKVKKEFQKLVAIVTPEDFLSPLASQPELESKYADLLSYLQTRYWRNK